MPESAALEALLDDAVHAPVERAWVRIADELGEPTRVAVAKARDAQGEVRRSAGLDGPPPATEEELAERALRYASVVAEEVLRPLAEALRVRPPLAGSLIEMHRLASDVEAGAASLPRSLQAPCDGGCFEPRSADSAWRSGRKVWTRTRRRVWKGQDTRLVPLSRVAQGHAAQRVMPDTVRHAAEVVRGWAGWLGALEAGWSGWADDVVKDVAELEPALPEEGDVGEEDRTVLQRSWQRLADADDALASVLADAAVGHPEDRARSAADTALRGWRESAAADLAVAGTGLADGSGTPPSIPDFRDVDRWTRWEAEVVDRLELVDTLVGVLDTVHAVGGSVAADLARDARSGWTGPASDATATMGALATRLGRGELSRGTLQGALGEATAALHRLRESLPSSESLDAAAGRAADHAVGAVQSRLRRVPVTVGLHRLQPPGREVARPEAEGRTVRVHDMARQAFDALRMERVRTLPVGVVELAHRLSASVDEVDEVVRYGFEAALQELEEGGDGSAQRAQGVAVEALSRAADGLGTLTPRVEETASAIEARLTAELLEGAERLVDRALADRVQAGWMDARSALAGWVEGAREQAGPRFGEWIDTGRRGMGRARAVTSWALRRSQSLMSGTPDELALRTPRMLEAAGDKVEGIPLVYQRLFALEPLSDATLLSGRDAALAATGARWRRWHDADGVPLIVTGQPGSGISSFFGVFAGRMTDEGATVVHHRFEERITNEVELAAVLRSVLGLPEAEGDLDQVAAVVLDTDLGRVPDLVAVQGLEHLYIRVPGGTDLLERFLTLMAETEPRMFWLGSLTDSAWQLVEKSEPTAVAQVERMALPPLTAREIRDAVLLRHRRSGVPLHYEEPVEGRALLRRRLRKARTADARAHILEEDFFDRLHRASQGNMRLALFQWLRSADFTYREGELTMRPLEALDFTFLEGLDTTQNFTLKAFLEHQTLTLHEHDLVFRLPRQESYQIFESLKNRHIIERVGAADQEGRSSEVTGHLRYRIQPLLTGAVSLHLASRNIVH